ncbi:hypothetical protein CSE45_5511 [Citreicella sp. SE45]|nr:hypothetical protein CSE45_5511 [Citreicella sp. SE45]
MRRQQVKAATKVLSRIIWAESICSEQRDEGTRELRLPRSDSIQLRTRRNIGAFAGALAAKGAARSSDSFGQMTAVAAFSQFVHPATSGSLGSNRTCGGAAGLAPSRKPHPSLSALSCRSARGTASLPDNPKQTSIATAANFITPKRRKI